MPETNINNVRLTWTYLLTTKVGCLALILLALPMAAISSSGAIFVPSDSSAQYVEIQNKRSSDLAILQTIRQGRNGVSFSTRLINCKTSTFKYLVDIDGKENMQLFMDKNNIAMQSLNENNMKSLTHGSVSYYMYKHACGK